MAAAGTFVAEDMLDLAKEHLARAFELEPNRWDWFLARGRITLEQGDTLTALQNFQQAHDRNPQHPGVQFFLGAAFGELGEYEKALEAFRAVLRYDDGNHGELVKSAQHAITDTNEALAATKGDSAAIGPLEQRARSGDAQAQNNLAVYYTRRTNPDYGEAIQWFKRGAAQEDPQAQYNLAKLYFAGKRTDKDINEALKWLHRAADNGHRDATFELASAT